jgi:hypothetical protein
MLPIIAAYIIGVPPRPGADLVVEARIQVQELFFRWRQLLVLELDTKINWRQASWDNSTWAKLIKLRTDHLSVFSAFEENYYYYYIQFVSVHKN